jgi:hypothetical protein
MIGERKERDQVMDARQTKQLNHRVLNLTSDCGGVAKAMCPLGGKQYQGNPVAGRRECPTNETADVARVYGYTRAATNSESDLLKPPQSNYILASIVANVALSYTSL